MNNKVTSHDLTLRVFSGPSELDELVPQWTSLVETLPCPALSQLPVYYQAFTSAFHPEPSDFFAVAIYLGDALVALLPLRIARRKILGVNLAALEFPQLPMPVRDVIVSPRVSFRAAFDCLQRHLGKVSGIRWDYLHFRSVLDTSSLLEEGTIQANAPAIQQQLGYSHALDVSAPGYIERVLNSKARNNLRRNHRKLAELGPHEFCTVDAFPDLDTAYGQFLEAEAAGWKSVHGGRRAVKLHQDQTDFYRDLMSRAATEGGCQIHLLFLNGKAIAADYCIVTRDVCYSLKHGYDEQFANVAPGNLLREFAINYYCGRPEIRTVDLISDQQWHLTWRPTRRKVLDIKIFRRAPRARLLYHLLKSRTKKSQDK